MTHTFIRAGLDLRIFFLNDTATTEIYTLSLHDALPISLTTGQHTAGGRPFCQDATDRHGIHDRSEEHTSELQSRVDLVCRLLLEKKKISFGNSGPTTVFV